MLTNIASRLQMDRVTEFLVTFKRPEAKLNGPILIIERSEWEAMDRPDHLMVSYTHVDGVV